VGNVITKPALVSTAATTLSDRDRIDRLEELVADLLDRDATREAESVVLTVRVGWLESQAPAPRFDAPSNGITIDEASRICGYAASTLYRWWRLKKIGGEKHGGRVLVDPSTLPRDKLTM
jgi:hypothetical protein